MGIEVRVGMAWKLKGYMVMYTMQMGYGYGEVTCPLLS